MMWNCSMEDSRFIIMWCRWSKIEGEVNWREGRPKRDNVLIQGRFRLDKNVADTKLESTSLSADVFIHPL